MSTTFIKDELELAIKESLEQIVDHFGLDEVGSPYMELHALADGMLDGGAAPRLGAVRVWRPRMDAEHGPAVEKLVHLKFSVKSLTSQWLLAFSSGNSLVPHFSLGLSTRGLSEAACGGASGVHVDLISKLPLSSSSEYAQRCYHPLRAARERVLSTLRALPAHGSQLELGTMQKEAVSPCLLAVQIEEQLEGAAAPLVVGGVQAYLRHWISLHRSPQLQLGSSGAWFAGSADELWRSDQARGRVRIRVRVRVRVRGRGRVSAALPRLSVGVRVMLLAVGLLRVRVRDGVGLGVRVRVGVGLGVRVRVRVRLLVSSPPVACNHARSQAP